MGLKSIYQQIQTRLSSLTNVDTTPLFAHVGTWNNQITQLVGKTNNERALPFPAAFLQVNVDTIEQLGVRNQLWNCTVNVHIAHQLYNADDGRFEENFEVFDLVDTTWQSLQTFKLSGGSEMVAVKSEQDYNHGNLYHFIQSYKFNYVQNYDEGKTATTAYTFTLSGGPQTIIIS